MYVLRWYVWGLCVTASWLNMQSAFSQVVVWQKGQKSFPAVKPEPVVNAESGESLAPSVKLVRLSAADEPIPALKYRLWVSPALRQPGDAQGALMQAQVMFLAHPKRMELSATYRDQEWDQLSLKQLAQSGARDYLAQQREILDQVYHATNLGTVFPRDVSAQLNGRVVFDGLLIEQRHNRELARLVHLDARLALAEQKFDTVIANLAAGFRLAELTHENTTPTMMSRLVSFAICGMMFEIVEELSQQEGVPNLYWALASLPEQFWDLRSAFEGEANFMRRTMRPLLEPIAPGTSPHELNVRATESVRSYLNILSEAVYSNITQASSTVQQNDRDASAKLAAGLVLLFIADASRYELPTLMQGELDQLSDVEVTLRVIQFELERGRDNIFKWGLTPTGIGDEMSAEINALTQGPDFLRPANIVLGTVQSALEAAESAAQRTNSMHKQLLLREALRAYAARNAGTLPANLDALRPVPAPPNPLTGMMFDYERLNDKTAIIRRERLYPGEEQTEFRIEMR